jgi:hypothetical protein
MSDRRKFKHEALEVAGSLGCGGDPSWFAPHVDKGALSQFGIKTTGGGTHQSKTMMLADLGILLAARMESKPVEAIVDDNLLGKPSARARQAAAIRLRELYGVGEAPPPICQALFALWNRDPQGRPLLALLCALARDPTLRDGASPVLAAKVGTPVRSPAIAAAFEAVNPGRLDAKMSEVLARNAASSWTQAGFLEGPVRKIRVRPRATPTVAAYAALIASLCGFGGPALVESRWLDILDRPVEDRLALLRQAEGLGLARVRHAGHVMEIEIRRPMAEVLGVASLVRD